MPSVSFTPAARAELVEAQQWYEAEVAGLGRRFRTAIDALVVRMTDNPHLFPIVLKSVRRAVLSRFPYTLFFTIDDEHSVLVIACFHASRNPKKWQARV